MEEDEDSFRQAKSQCVRNLTGEEQEKLSRQDTRIVSNFKQEKLEKDALKNWDVFYKRNTTKFFKDRHWTTREFQDLCGKEVSKGRTTVLEVGCGVGNFVFPLLEELPAVYFHACDFSPRAVQFVKEDPRYAPDRCHAFQSDLTKDDLTQNVANHSVDIVTMIFVLSAIHPEKMVTSLQNIAQVLTPGGCVLFRDYGLYDHAMLRFSPGSKLAENLYVRQDGTRSFFFSKEKLCELFGEAGFIKTSVEYVYRETVNKKESLCVPRVFIQAKFTLPGPELDQLNQSDTDSSPVYKDADGSCVNELMSSDEVGGLSSEVTDDVVTQCDVIRLRETGFVSSQTAVTDADVVTDSRDVSSHLPDTVS